MVTMWRSRSKFGRSQSSTTAPEIARPVASVTSPERWRAFSGRYTIVSFPWAAASAQNAARRNRHPSVLACLCILSTPLRSSIARQTLEAEGGPARCESKPSGEQNTALSCLRCGARCPPDIANVKQGGGASAADPFHSPKGAPDMRLDIRSSRLVVLGSLVAFAPLALAQKEMRTEAQQDGFAGRVKSVATIAEMTNVQWRQPDGPTLVFPVFCRDCEYSPDGYRTKSGQILQGKFRGENLTLQRDGAGHVTEIVGTNTATGEVSRDVMIGPFGKTQETFYQNGKVSGQNSIRYDANGRVIERLAMDAAGAQVDRTSTTWGKDDWIARTAESAKDQVRTR